MDRIYISRKQANNRRIINEDEMINFLTKFGFQSVTLESMSVTAQASLLANAKVVISPHGGGLTNLVFCHPGTKVIEIFSPNYIYSCYWLVSNLVGLEYYYLLGENSLGFSFHEFISPNHRLEDIFVNINHLLELMKFVEIT
ncbi:MAG: glycosyltransferase family 61 protein [Okeania sp. SIO3B3]|nr:glycosyltransferase family 61 protein [Okeania sp. SIO3B3]